MSTSVNTARMTINFGQASQKQRPVKSNLYIVDIFNFDGECEHVEVFAKSFSEASEYATDGLHDVSYINVYQIQFN